MSITVSFSWPFPMITWKFHSIGIHGKCKEYEDEFIFGVLQVAIMVIIIIIKTIIYLYIKA